MENTVNVKELLTKKLAELEQVKNQIQQLNKQMMQLQSTRDQYTTQGIELQGMIKILDELVTSK
jgi:prefoldin subunit 5